MTQRIVVTLILAFTAASLGCGKLDAVMDSTVGMSDKMNVMAEGIRLQKLGEGLKMLFHEDNTKTPDLPLLMFPGGRLVADNATTKELVELVYLWWQEANQVAPDERRKTVKGSDGDMHFPTDYIISFNHDKLVRVAAIRVVASLTPREKVQEIIQEQIVEGGRYETIAYVFLTARARYLNDILLRLDLLDTERMSNLGIIEEAYTRAANLKFLLGLPYQDRLTMDIRGLVNSEGNKDPDQAITDKIDIKEAQSTIADVKRKANSELTAKWKSHPNYPALKAKIDAL